MKSLLICILFLFGILSNHVLAQNSIVTTVLYDTDSSNLTIIEKGKLISFIKSLDTVKITRISVLAYCDDVGKNTHNDSLSNQRAQKVCIYLKGVVSNKKVPIAATGKGALELTSVSKRDINTQRAHNRRSEITIFYDKKVGKRKSSGSDFSQFDTLKVGDKLILDNILFEGGRHNVLPESLPALDSLVKALRIHKTYNITILGHVCCTFNGEDGEDFDTHNNNLKMKYIY